MKYFWMLFRNYSISRQADNINPLVLKSAVQSYEEVVVPFLPLCSDMKLGV